MTLLPIFLKLEGRNCLLVGAGNIALDKIGTLLPTGLNLRVIASEARQEIQQLAEDHKLELIQRPFDPSDLDGNFLVVAATNDPATNAAIYQGCLE
jgi:siroheme synthase-like protein